MSEHEPVSSIFDYSPDVYKSAVIKLQRPPVIDVTEPYAHGGGFETKTEFHITVLPSELFERLELEQSNALAEELRLVCEKYSTVEYEDAIYHISKSKWVEEDGGEFEYDRESLILPIKNDSDLAMEISKVYLDLGFKESDIPFLHVTLFTRPATDIARRGIGIANYQEWLDLNPQVFRRLS